MTEFLVILTRFKPEERNSKGIKSGFFMDFTQMGSFLKLYRELEEKSFYKKDSEKVHLWIHLLIRANWKEREENLGGKPIVCKPGQFTTGRKQLSEQTGISESKIERLLTYFEKIEQQIEQQKTSTNRLITIVNWNIYQLTEQQNEQQLNNDRTTSEQRVNTLKEEEEYKKKKNINKEYIKEVYDLLNLIKVYFDQKYINDKSLDCLDKLIRLDNYTSDQILQAIKNARSQSFWDTNFISPLKLRDKDSNDVKYIDRFLKLKSNGINGRAKTTGSDFD